MAGATPSLRLFYALWPDAAARMALTHLQPALAGRQTHPDDLHLTLAFLGAQPATRLADLLAILASIAKPCLDLTLDRIGYFPNSRIAWAGMQSIPAALSSLREELLAQLARHGIDGAARGAFTPHVTLARNAPPPAPVAIDVIHWQARHFVLVESVTQDNGVRYRVLG
jgi:2'-5' RNA ligase